jgi:hypothetical protein
MRSRLKMFRIHATTHRANDVIEFLAARNWATKNEVGETVRRDVTVLRAQSEIPVGIAIERADPLPAFRSRILSHLRHESTKRSLGDSEHEAVSLRSRHSTRLSLWQRQIDRRNPEHRASLRPHVNRPVSVAPQMVMRADENNPAVDRFGIEAAIHCSFIAFLIRFAVYRSIGM